MSNELQSLEGRVVSSIMFLHDYLIVIFHPNIHLGIYNDYIYIPGNIFGMFDNTVSAVLEDSDKITIEFDNESRLIIGMRDEDYRSPEAGYLCVPDSIYVTIH